ncbi:MAG TPA: aldo/keto reductase [Candidatus Eisenbacteria bacterium]|nr:aldo/keto reductase [Candidatus Eisenbacteria bacterium]
MGEERDKGMPTGASGNGMEYRKLGKTDLEVSILGFGTATLGDIYGAADPQEAIRATHLAIERGINFFDSSPYYGRNLSEERLGQALAGWRDKVILATKTGRYGLNEFDFSAKRVYTSIDESLKRLKTGYLDLFQAHDVEFGDFRQIVEETLPAMRKVQESGKARYIGITGYPPGFLLKIAQHVPVDTILSYCHYNLLNTRMDTNLTPFAKTNSVGLINASALHMGMLTEAGGPAWHPAPATVREASRRIEHVCRRYGKSISDVALRYSLDHPYVSCTLVGMSTQAEVEANLESLQMKSDSSLVSEIRTAVGTAFDIDWPSGNPENNV